VKRLVLTAAAVAAIVTTAAAQTRSPADLIRERQAHYKQMGGAMKGLYDQLHSDTPSLDAIRQSSRTVVTFAPQLLRWFPRGTGPEAGVRTRALPEIWSDNQNFRRAGATFWSPPARSTRRRSAATWMRSAPPCRRSPTPAAIATTISGPRNNDVAKPGLSWIVSYHL